MIEKLDFTAARSNQFQRLTEHQYVTRLHKGLYELADDPAAEGYNTT